VGVDSSHHLRRTAHIQAEVSGLFYILLERKSAINWLHFYNVRGIVLMKFAIK
jgi:hypothetical protein